MFDSIQNRIIVPDNLRYTDDHIWMEYSDPGLIKCGITGYLSKKIGEIISVEYIRNILNMQIFYDEPILLIETLNDLIKVKAPISGVVIEINDNCFDIPDLINSEPYGGGWLFIISSDNPYDFDTWMHSDEYESLVTKEIEDIQLL